MTQWKYENHDLGEQPLTSSTLWECDTLVMFQGLGVETDWHGEMRMQQDGSMTVMFNARGSNYPLRSTILFPMYGHAQETWTGTDYRGRRITLTEVGALRLHLNNQYIREP